MGQLTTFDAGVNVEKVPLGRRPEKGREKGRKGGKEKGSRAHLQQFKNVESNVKVGETGVELLEVGVIDVFEDDGRGFGLLEGTRRGKGRRVSSSSTSIRDRLSPYPSPTAFLAAQSRCHGLQERMSMMMMDIPSRCSPRPRGEAEGVLPLPSFLLSPECLVRGADFPLPPYPFATRPKPMDGLLT